MCTSRMGKTHSTARTRGSRGPFVDVFFVARKPAPLSFLVVGEKKDPGDSVSAGHCHLFAQKQLMQVRLTWAQGARIYIC